ncbi:MAG: ribonuclease III [Oscillospiraceae bacterium]|nr:ribonuclease III [Oscillospiraceae bacterium]
MKLNYTFKNTNILQAALTHSSWVNENGGEHNERLEFLGDSILGFLSAEYLYQNNPGISEGELTRMRAGHVCEQTLAQAARKIELGKYLRMGRGELAGGGAERDSLLSDGFEAVLGAIYLDGGIEPCRDLVYRELMLTPMTISTQDAKTRLQELVQAEGSLSPEYRLVSEEGPDHQKVFTCQVYVDGICRGQGRGKSKKAAEQVAAATAIGTL